METWAPEGVPWFPITSPVHFFPLVSTQLQRGSSTYDTFGIIEKAFGNRYVWSGQYQQAGGLSIWTALHVTSRGKRVRMRMSTRRKFVTSTLLVIVTVYLYIHCANSPVYPTS